MTECVGYGFFFLALAVCTQVFAFVTCVSPTKKQNFNVFRAVSTVQCWMVVPVAQTVILLA